MAVNSLINNSNFQLLNNTNLDSLNLNYNSQSQSESHSNSYSRSLVNSSLFSSSPLPPSSSSSLVANSVASKYKKSKKDKKSNTNNKNNNKKYNSSSEVGNIMTNSQSSSSASPNYSSTPISGSSSIMTTGSNTMITDTGTKLPGEVPEALQVNGTTPSGKPRLFVCSTCTRAFARQEHLKRHERSHTKEKPFSCGVCSRKFSRRDLLLRHAQKLHAGCSDTAITRLRKKSIRRSSTSSSIGSTPMGHNNNNNDDSISSTIRSKKMVRGSISGASSSINNTIILNNNSNNNGSFSAGSISKPRTSSISNLKNSSKIETIKTILENKTEEISYNNKHHMNNMGGHNSTSTSPSSSLSSDFLVGNQFNLNKNDSKNAFNNFNNGNVNGNGNGNVNGNNNVTTNNSSNNNLQQFNEDVLTDLPFLRNHLPMNRRVSFSAMSGNNYATSFNQPYASETVEFATPQMMPMDDAENWLNNLDEIPSLDFINPNFQNKQNEQNNQHQKQQQQHHQHQQQQQQQQQQYQNQQTQLKNESPAEAISGYSFYDVPSKNVESLFSHSNRMPISGNNANNNASNKSVNMNQNMFNSHLNSLLLSPLLHDSPDIDSSPSSQTQGWPNFNNNNGRQPSKLANNSNRSKSNTNYNKDNSKSKVNFDNDINELELLTDLNASRDYNLPAGYSFYGSNDVQSNVNNNSSCSSSNATISPILLDNAYGNSSTISNQPPNNLNSNSSFNSPFSRPNTSQQQQHSIPPQEQQHHHQQQQQQQNQYNDQQQQMNSEVKNIPSNISNNFEKYSTTLLFTNLIRNCIHFSLSKYPFIGLQNPTIPDNDKLNFYTKVFEEKFLLHHPFIHKSFLNEFSLIKATLKNINTSKLNDLANSNGNMNNINASGTSDYIKVSLICFPLLVATIGAVYCNRKADAANLYEASRRSIHVYLDFRKKQQQQMQNQRNGEATPLNDNSSPLWLIQSLTLSIIYGLFADNDICLNVIIRQVNALNSLLKSSGLTMISWNYDSNKNIDDKYFENYIQYESTVRTIHTIFHISAMLSSLYNIVPSLKVDELFIDLPVNSIVWNTNNANEFKQVYMTFFHKPEKFSKVLGDLLEFPFNPLGSSSISPVPSTHSSSPSYSTRSLSVKNFLVDNQISEFGLNCLLNGLHQYNYFQKLGESNDANNNNNSNNNNDNNNTAVHNNSNIDANLLDKLSNSQKYNSVSNNHISHSSNMTTDVLAITADTRIQNIINSWDNMISGSSAYDQKSELVNDCKILNHYLSIKSSGIISLNRVKESVWLKSWNDMCELYYNTYKFKEADILRDNTLSHNLRDVVGHSVEILKLVFFKKDINKSSISSLSSAVGGKKICEGVNSLTLNEDQLKEITDENLGELDFENFTKHLSIDLQILFDVFLVLVKFLITFERNSKIKMRYNNLNSNINFVHHFELQSNILPFNYNSNSAINGPIPGLSENLSSISLIGNSGKSGNEEGGDEAAKSKQNDLEFFKLYKLIFKLFLNLEFFLKVNYGYHDFESEFANLTISSIVNKYKNKDINIGIDSNVNKFVDSNNFDKLNGSKSQNNTSDEDLSSRDRDLIINELINFKLPFKLLKIGEFLFSFLYDKNIKFVNFKNLSSGLFHLRIFLENREEYFE